MDSWEIASDDPWDVAVAMVGREVKVWLSRDPESTVTGQLLLLCEDGSFRVRGEDGMVHYAWPALRIEAVDV